MGYEDGLESALQEIVGPDRLPNPPEYPQEIFSGIFLDTDSGVESGVCERIIDQLGAKEAVIAAF